MGKEIILRIELDDIIHKQIQWVLGKRFYRHDNSCSLPHFQAAEQSMAGADGIHGRAHEMLAGGSMEVDQMGH